jgi:hypothetical protein
MVIVPLAEGKNTASIIINRNFERTGSEDVVLMVLTMKSSH